jgi:hypothetical protein
MHARVIVRLQLPYHATSSLSPSARRCVAVAPQRSFKAIRKPLVERKRACKLQEATGGRFNPLPPVPNHWLPSEAQGGRLGDIMSQAISSQSNSGVSINERGEEQGGQRRLNKSKASVGEQQGLKAARQC